LIIGSIALLLALKMTSVLDLMLHSYSFMVSGMIIPVLAALFSKNPNKVAALLSMLTGGSLTLFLILSGLDLPLDLDANIFGIAGSLLVYVLVATVRKQKRLTV
jgi:SSS family solute:Na+ symporter